MTEVRATVIVSGRVQGVAFRYHTRKTAAAHALTGWVRNNPDGTVEAVFEGREEAVAALVEWCRRGPAMARVDSVETTWSAATGAFDAFTVTL
jgi:acylphosphatase